MRVTAQDRRGISAAHRVDLIALDINLPDIGGYEVARLLRSPGKRGRARAPIIAITANALRGDGEKALEAGCNVYMSEPLSIRGLAVRVQDYLPTPPELLHGMRL